MENKNENGAKQFNALVIEDNHDLAKLFGSLLAVLGGSTRIAWSVDEGLEKAAAFPPDIVFCDIGLPGIKSGIDFAKEFRQDERFRHIPIIAITGRSDFGTSGKSGLADFDDVFQKPVKFAKLLDTLRIHQLC